MLLHEDVDHARIDVIVPAAGQIWWRAAVRARLESTHAAARPMTWMHGITGAIVIGAMLAVVTAVWPMIPELMLTDQDDWRRTTCRARRSRAPSPADCGKAC